MTIVSKRRGMLLAGVAAAALTIHPANAQEADRTAVLEQRVKQLEDALREVKGELEATKRQQAASAAATAPGVPVTTGTVTAQAANGATPTPIQTASAQSAQTQPAGGSGFRVGNTTFKISGFIKADAMVSDYSDGDTATNGLGRDFYLPQFIPVDKTPGAGEGNDFDAHAKQTRLAISAETPVGSKTLTAYVETDFQTSPGTQGSERTTNGYNLALRRAYIGYDGWVFGQDWTVFQNTASLPESADFIGVSEGTVFVRQMQVRVTRPLTRQLSFTFGLENPETASITPTSPATVENDDDSLPDATAKLTFKPALGEFTLAGVVRKLEVNSAASNESTTGWGVSLAGKVPFGANGRHDIRFMISHGSGVGRYVGVNFAPDVIAAPQGLETVDVTAGFAALHFGLTDKLRTNLMYSFQDVDYPSGLAPATANEAASSYAINLFYSPIKAFDLGVEYRHGKRELLNGDSGKLDRLHFVAKHAF